MPNQNTNKSPKKLWKTPSPSKPSLSGPNLQFADLEANTLDELSMEELSFVSGGDGKGIYIIGEFRLEGLPINKNTFVPTNPNGVTKTLDLSGLQGNSAEVVGSSEPGQGGASVFPMFIISCYPYGGCNGTAFVKASVKN